MLTRLTQDTPAYLETLRALARRGDADLEQAAERGRRYHLHQLDTGFSYREDGIELGQRIARFPAGRLHRDRPHPALT